MIIVDGVSYDVPVISMKRSADFLDKYASRNAKGVLKRKLIGVYYNYQLQFGSTTDTTVYQALWDKLTEPTEFHTVTVPDETGNYTFTAYFASVQDEVRKVTASKNFFKSLQAHFIAQQPARTP